MWNFVSGVLSPFFPWSCELSWYSSLVNITDLTQMHRHRTIPCSLWIYLICMYLCDICSFRRPIWFLTCIIILNAPKKKKILDVYVLEFCDVNIVLSPYPSLFSLALRLNTYACTFVVDTTYVVQLSPATAPYYRCISRRDTATFTSPVRQYCLQLITDHLWK